MPHAFIIAAAVTASVGAAIAFEVNVFKPWREEHWTDGWAEGVKQEWNEFTESVRDGFDEISGDQSRRRNGGGLPREDIDGRGRRRRRNSDQQEELELKREMDEFSQHEAQVSGVKARYADEFDQAQQGARLRKGKSVLEASAMEDRQLLDAPTLGYHASSMRSDNDNDTLKSYDGQFSHIQQARQASPPHNNAPWTAYSDRPIPVEGPSKTSHEELVSIWHSPRSALADHNDTLSDDWHDHLSPRTTPPHTAVVAYDDGEDGTESWIQLDDSRSASPMSAAWSETEFNQTTR